MARNRDTARDRAGYGPDPDRGVRLVPIDRLRDFRISKDDPDIRGWEVRTVSGRQLGSVKDLLVDPEAGEVVMMDIELTRDDRRTLAPLRAAQIDRDRRSVIIDSAEVERGYQRAAEYAADSRDAHEPPERADESTHREEPRTRQVVHADDRADAVADEVVVERRPVVYEEVVVRRKDVSRDDELDEPRRVRPRDDVD